MEEKLLKTIGDNILLLRKSRHLSQVQMAVLLGYSERQYRRLEKDGTVNLGVVMKIADKFNMPFLDLLKEN